MSIFLEYIIGTLLTVLVFLISIHSMSPIKLSKKGFVGFIFVSLFFPLILRSISDYLITLCISIVIFVFLYYETKNILISLILSVFPTIIAFISNYLAITIFMFFKIDIHENSKNFYIYVLFWVVCIIIAFIISKIIGYILNKKLKILEIDIINKQVVLIIISSLVWIVIFYVNIVFGRDYYDNITSMIAIASLQIIQFTFMIYVMFYLVKSIRLEEENKRKEQLIFQLNQYTEKLEELQEEMKEFRHNYKNALCTMLDYFEDKDYKNLELYFLNIILPDSQIMTKNNFKIDGLKNIKISEIKGIISTKALIAQERKIEFLVDVPDKITQIKIEPLDLGKIIGIILDNAIEATNGCENPYVKFGILKTETEINIIILNTYKGIIPPVHKLYEKGFSSKGNNRGLGLYTLNKIKNKYDNVFIDISVSLEKNEFCLNINVI